MEQTISIDQKGLPQIQELLYDICGIHLADTRQTMMQNRINAMMKNPACKNIHSLEDLLAQVKTNSFVKQAFINNFTTNKTDLFREAYHFNDMLNRSLIPLLQNDKPVKIFCSAASSGEEPYSIAATCLYAKTIFQSKSNIKIIGTDIDTEMLELCRQGEYMLDPRLNKIPDWVEIGEYFDVLKELPQGVKHLKVKNNIKSMVSFQQLNLFNKTYPFGSQEFDIVFCRNVLIYFKAKDQETILTKLHNTLKVQGSLYLGHSEDILGLSPHFERLGNKIFLRKSDEQLQVL